MSTLARFAWRALVASRLRGLIVAAVLMLQGAGLGGALVAERSMLETRSRWSRALHLADLDVKIAAASRDELPSIEALRAIEGVAEVSARFVALRRLERVDAPPLPVVVHYMDIHAIAPVNRVALVRGAPLDAASPHDVLVDRSFADIHGVRIGDALELDSHRVPERVRVVGVGLSAEHLVSTANPEQLVPDRGSLGVVYAPRALLDARFPERLYNDLCFRFAPGADRAATTVAILRALEGVEVERVTPRASSFGERYLDVMLGGARVMAPVSALLASLIAAIVSCLAVVRTASERRREIGCLLALGWRPRELALVFFALGFIPAALGAVAGAPAAIAFGRLVARTSAAVAGFPEPIIAWAPRDLASGAALSVAVGLVASLLPAVAIARTMPARAMARTGEVRFDGAPRWFEALVRGSASVRYATRNLVRRPRLAAATLALVALAVCLPAGLLTSLTSWRTWAEDDAARARWDAVVTFKAHLTDEEAGELAGGAAEREPYVQGYAELSRAGVSPEQVRVRGLSTPSRMTPIAIVAGRALSSDNADEIILNAGFMQGRPPPRVGERVTILRRGARRELVVVGLVADAGLATAYVPRGVAGEIFGPRYSGMYIHFPETQRLADEMTRLRTADLVASVQSKRDLSVATSRYLSSFYAVLWPFVGLSAVIALSFLAGVVSFLVRERAAEYAVLRALGHDDHDIAKLIAFEVSLLVGAGVLASLLAWALSSWALRAAMAHAWFSVPIDFHATDWLAVLLPTLAAISLSLLPALRSERRFTLAGALGPRAIG